MRILPFTLALAVVALSAAAAPKSFDFKDPKSVNAISFFVDSPLEPIIGHASGVTGSLSFDPAQPQATTGKLSIEASAIAFPNKNMTKVLHGAKWLDVKANPDISFLFKEISEAKQDGDSVVLTVSGDFSLKGVTKRLTVPVRLTYVEGGAAKRGGSEQGDLLLARCSFIINRSDFRIMPNAVLEKVGNDIEIRFGIAGYTK